MAERSPLSRPHLCPAESLARTLVGTAQEAHARGAGRCAARSRRAPAGGPSASRQRRHHARTTGWRPNGGDSCRLGVSVHGQRRGGEFFFCFLAPRTAAGWFDVFLASDSSPLSGFFRWLFLFLCLFVFGILSSTLSTVRRWQAYLKLVNASREPAAAATATFMDALLIHCAAVSPALELNVQAAWRSLHWWADNERAKLVRWTVARVNSADPVSASLALEQESPAARAIATRLRVADSDSRALMIAAAHRRAAKPANASVAAGTAKHLRAAARGARKAHPVRPSPRGCRSAPPLHLARQRRHPR